FNPEPLAPFLDGVLLGDGEEAIGDICDVVLAQLETPGRDRQALLRALAAIPGFYVPAFFEPRYHADGTIAEVVPLDPARPKVRKRVLFDLDRFAPPPNPIVPNLGASRSRCPRRVSTRCRPASSSRSGGCGRPASRSPPRRERSGCATSSRRNTARRSCSRPRGCSPTSGGAP